MIGMVAVLGIGICGMLWFTTRKQAGKPAYQPTGKIRWSDEEKDA